MHSILRFIMAILGAIVFYQSILLLKRMKATGKSPLYGETSSTITDFRIMLVAALLLIVVSFTCIIHGYYGFPNFHTICESGFVVLTLFPVIILYRWGRRLD